MILDLPDQDLCMGDQPESPARLSPSLTGGGWSSPMVIIEGACAAVLASWHPLKVLIHMWQLLLAVSATYLLWTLLFCPILNMWDVIFCGA